VSVRVDSALALDVRKDGILQCLPVHVGNHAGAYLTCVAVQRSNHGKLPRARLVFAESRSLCPLAEVPVLRLAPGKGFIDFARPSAPG